MRILPESRNPSSPTNKLCNAPRRKGIKKQLVIIQWPLVRHTDAAFATF